MLGKLSGGIAVGGSSCRSLSDKRGGGGPILREVGWEPGSNLPPFGLELTGEGSE